MTHPDAGGLAADGRSAGPGRLVGVWGDSPTAWRGRRRLPRAQRMRGFAGRGCVSAFGPAGRAPGPLARRGPIGLLLDPLGLHFDPDTPSLLKALIASPEAAAQSDEARAGIARLIAADLSKYNGHLPGAEPPAPGYVLVIDQTRRCLAAGAGRAFLRC